MKRNILCCMTIFCAIYGIAQINYFPEGITWTILDDSGDIEYGNVVTYSVEGDSVINNLTYKKIGYYLVRQEGYKVYLREINKIETHDFFII